MNANILSDCRNRMKGLAGKARDDAASHFLAGVKSASPGLFPAGHTMPSKYVDVLEQLADALDAQPKPAGDED